MDLVLNLEENVLFRPNLNGSLMRVAATTVCIASWIILS